jgi:hypothetical protein
LGVLFITQSLGLVSAQLHFTADFFAFARTTCAILAAIGHVQALSNASGEQSFVALNRETAPTGLHHNLKSHACYPWKPV